MSRFDDMMRRAANVSAELEERAITDFEKVIARGVEVDKKRERATDAHLAKLDTMHAKLDGFERSIDEYSNGAAPLDDGAKSNDNGATEPPRNAWSKPST